MSARVLKGLRSAAVASLLGCLALASADAADTYEIGPGDALKVAVIGQAEMTGSFTVDAEGMINFPILGKVKAAELTTSELERKITTLLANGYLRRPQVTVMIGEYGSQKVFVTGEVQRPGQYALKADRSLLALLGDIGPLGANVGHEVIVVRPPVAVPPPPTEPTPEPDPLHPDERASAPNDATTPATEPAGETPAATPTPSPTPSPEAIPGLPFVAPGSQVFRISLLELQSGNPEKNIRLQAGDTVYFPRASQVYVMGNVARPGPYRYQEGMTVLQALTLAGGATERGSSGRAKLIRIEKGKKIERKAKATDIVQPDDTLVVPERFF